MADAASRHEIDADWWEQENTGEQQALFPLSAPSTPLIALHPSSIEVQPVTVRRLVHLQRVMSRVVWRPSPGRNLAFVVHHKDQLVGIGFLSSPIFNLASRDAYLDTPVDKTQRGQFLRHYADLSVCVGAQPLAWHWNAGKLIAQLATTLGDIYQNTYGDELVGLTTTSVWGKGSQYNRLWKFLGYTQGYGNCHIPDHVYRHMVEWMDANDVERLQRTDSSVRMRNAGRFQRAVGRATSLGEFHGQKRAIYYAPAARPDDRLAVIESWYERWGRPRYERTKDREPPYRDGITV